MGKVIFVSHCVLNQYARAQGVKNMIPDAARVDPVVNLLVEYNIAIVQLPCPEIEYEGLVRRACGQNRYKNDIFMDICDKNAELTLGQILQYRDAGHQVVGFVGVDGSPTCGIRLTALGRGKYASRPGLFFEKIFERLDNEKIYLRSYGVRLRNEKQISEMEKQIRLMLESCKDFTGS